MRDARSSEPLQLVNLTFGETAYCLILKDADLRAALINILRSL